MTDNRIIDQINDEAKRQDKAGKKPKIVRINIDTYDQLVKECRDEIEKMRKNAARVFKADWVNFMDQADEEKPVESIYTQIGHLKFELDEDVEGFRLE